MVTLTWHACKYKVHKLHRWRLPVEFMYLVFTCMPGESYRRQLRSLLLYLCDVFPALTPMCVDFWSLWLCIEKMTNARLLIGKLCRSLLPWLPTWVMMLIYMLLDRRWQTWAWLSQQWSSRLTAAHPQSLTAVSPPVSSCSSSCLPSGRLPLLYFFWILCACYLFFCLSFCCPGVLTTPPSTTPNPVFICDCLNFSFLLYACTNTHTPHTHTLFSA